MIVIDTNVLSEAMRATPAVAVIDWMRRQATSHLFTTTITEAELRYGLKLLADGRRRQAMSAVLEAIFDEDFAGRILSFDRSAAQAYASIAARRRSIGRPISQADAMIAAIAFAHGASVATRNISDFEGCGVGLIDPWAIAGDIGH